MPNFAFLFVILMVTFLPQYQVSVYFCYYSFRLLFWRYNHQEKTADIDHFTCEPGPNTSEKPGLVTNRILRQAKMAVFHDEIEIEDFEFDEESDTYFYPCPCGDQFQITKVSDDRPFLLICCATSPVSTLKMFGALQGFVLIIILVLLLG